MIASRIVELATEPGLLGMSERRGRFF